LGLRNSKATMNGFFTTFGRFLLLYLLRPVVLLCGALVSTVYNVLFAWWLDGLTSRGLWRRLERDIRNDYSWLFQEYKATVLPFKPYRQVLDYANVTVAVGDLLFEFTRGHGGEDFHVTVAPVHAPHDWYSFGEAIVLACSCESNRRNDEMSQFEPLFRANIERLQAFFSERQYGPARRNKSVNRLIRIC
jgi:hypothetical protein